MSKPRQPPRTQRQKLRDALTAAQRDLEAYPPRGLWPSSFDASRFDCYSRALRDLVVYHLSDPGWDVDPTSWIWDGQEHFNFHYTGRADLTRTNDKPRRMYLFTTAKLSIDPEVDLDDELARLSEVSLRYRDAVKLMERESASTQERNELSPRIPSTPIAKVPGLSRPKTGDLR